MNRAIFILLLLIVCSAARSSAQFWRVELSGGILTPTDLKPNKLVQGPRSPFPTIDLMGIESDFGTITGLGGVKLMHCDSAYEWGIGADILAIRFRGGAFSVDTATRSGPKQGVTQDAYLARPAIPLRGFFNYCHHRSCTYAFIGVNAGVVFARGRDMQDAYTLPPAGDWTIYFQNAVGYTLGTQLGVRHSYGKIDVGGELAATFMHLPLTQGTSRAAYTYNILYPSVRAFIGYSF